MQGGSVQGIGWGINEEYFMNADGAMDNFTLLDYRMPTSLDLPMIDTVIVEVANPGHPLRRPGRGRGQHYFTTRGHRQCHLQRHGRPDGEPANESSCRAGRSWQRQRYEG